MKECIYQDIVERWCVFEVTVDGATDGNPFVDYYIKGVFKGKNEEVEVDGFYDGDVFIKSALCLPLKVTTALRYIVILVIKLIVETLLLRQHQRTTMAQLE